MRIFGISEGIGNVRNLSIQYRAAADRRTVWSLRISLQDTFYNFGRKIVVRDMVEMVAIVQPDDTEHSLAQTRCAFDDRIEHRLRVGRRTADDVQYLAGRPLMLECF